MSQPDPEDALVSLDTARVVGADPWLETRLDHPEDIAVTSDGPSMLAAKLGSFITSILPATMSSNWPGQEGLSSA